MTECCCGSWYIVGTCKCENSDCTSCESIQDGIVIMKEEDIVDCYTEEGKYYSDHKLAEEKRFSTQQEAEDYLDEHRSELVLEASEICCSTPGEGEYYILDVYVYTAEDGIGDCGGGEKKCGGTYLRHFYLAKIPSFVNGCYIVTARCLDGDHEYDYYEGRCEETGEHGNIIAGPFDGTYARCLAKSLNLANSLCDSGCEHGNCADEEYN